MEKQPTLLKQEKGSQKSSKNKAPVKVVYISNPMKIKASPSEFRAVVQQLTGRYATCPPACDDLLPRIIKKDDHSHQDKYCSTRSDLSAGCREDDDEVMNDDFIITPQMFDGYSPLLPSSDHFRS
ncbi:hypothetical protein R6Q57_004841 [Mikania cordata]